VILVAAGGGVRLGAGMPKAFAPLCGEPILAHALRGVLGCREVWHVVIVAPGSHLDQSRAVADQSGAVTDQSRTVADYLADPPRVDVVAGGADRSASVRAGLAALSNDDGIVLVHDVARCLAPAGLFANVISAVRAGHPAVVPGLEITDTVKVVDAQNRVLATPDRTSLRAIQTPQGFLREVLEDAHAHAQATITSATDDAGLVERNGGQVLVVDGDHRALKITTAADLALASALLQEPHHAG